MAIFPKKLPCFADSSKVVKKTLNYRKTPAYCKRTRLNDPWTLMTRALNKFLKGCLIWCHFSKCRTKGSRKWPIYSLFQNIRALEKKLGNLIFLRACRPFKILKQESFSDGSIRNKKLIKYFPEPPRIEISSLNWIPRSPDLRWHLLSGKTR